MQSSISWRCLDKRNKGTRSLGFFCISDPLSKEGEPIDFAVTLNTKVDSFLVSRNVNDDDSEDDDTWINENEEPTKNTFDLMDDL